MKYSTAALSIAFMLIVVLVTQAKRQQEAAPFEVEGTQPDEYGVVCYRDSRTKVPLGCVQVQYDAE